MLLTKKIKLEVSEQDAATLEFMQGKCRALYKWWVMRLRNGEKWNLYSAKKSLQASRTYDPELNAVYGKLLHEVYFRLDKAMTAFFRRLKAGGETGVSALQTTPCVLYALLPLDVHPCGSQPRDQALGRQEQTLPKY